MTAVIDPLGVGDLTPIGNLLADPSIEKIFHDADYDLRLFDRQFGFRARRLFDTRIAAQFLNEPGIGLGALLEKYFGVMADKRFQRADWSARPLSPAMLEYAAGDTTNLCELQHILRKKLEDSGRLRLGDRRIRTSGGNPVDGRRRRSRTRLSQAQGRQGPRSPVARVAPRAAFLAGPDGSTARPRRIPGSWQRGTVPTGATPGQHHWRARSGEGNWARYPGAPRWGDPAGDRSRPSGPRRRPPAVAPADAPRGRSGVRSAARGAKKARNAM